MAKERSTTFFRANDWWIGKASTLLMLVYLYSYLLQIPFEKFIWLGAVSLVVIIGFASFGYLTNDWFDQEQDALAGKKNIFQGKSRFIRLCYFLIAFILIVVPWLVLPFNTKSIALIFIELSLFLIYSVPPIRLKEKNYFGLLVDALYAHAVPAYFALHTFQLAAGKSLPLYFVVFLMLWQFFIGFRNIMIHQINDTEEDKKAGVRNWSAEIEVNKVWIAVHSIVTVEVLLLLYIIYFAFGSIQKLQLISLAVLLFFFFVYVLYHKTKRYFFSAFVNWVNFPNFYYEYFLSVITFTTLIIYDKSYFILVGFHVVLFFIPAIISTIKLIFGIYLSIPFFGLFLTCFYIPIRRLISFIVNISIYYLFIIFGVDLIKEKMSAADYLKRKRNKK